MVGLALPVLILWALSVLSLSFVCFFLFAKGYFRRLPLFTSYIVLNLLQALYLCFVYWHFGVDSPDGYALSWYYSGAIILLARILAGIEIVRSVLSEYTGIWSLFSRLLIMASAMILSYAAVDASRDARWVLTVTDTGFHIAFAITMLLCLATVRYYPIFLHPVYRALLIGFTIYSCTSALADTLLKHFLSSQFRSYETIWQVMTVTPYVSIVILWATALRKPMAVTERPVLLPASVYRILSPAINRTLRRLNEQLSEMWPSNMSESSASVTEES